jgi:HNH endonuclease
MAISKRLRYEILRRDNHACRYCGAAAPDVKLTVDHVIPVALGGTDDPSNLVTACVSCNAGKSASSPDAPVVDDVAADALRWSKAMTRAAEITRADLKARMQQRAVFLDHVWGGWTYQYMGERCMFDLPASWEDTVDRFIALGINEEDFIEAVRIAMRSRARDPFPYMCGVLWNIVRERQEIAMQIVKGETADDGA